MQVDVARDFSERDVLTQVPLGRSRAIMVISGVVFGLALRLVSPTVARATHNPIPMSCYGYRECDNCCGPACCPGCSQCNNCGCPGDPRCWIICDGCNYWQCCDNVQNGTRCICTGFIGTCGPGPC